MFNKLVYVKELVVVLLTAILVFHTNVSMAAGMQEVSRNNLIYESTMGVTTPKCTTLVVYMTTMMVKGDTTSASNTQSPDPRNSAVITMHRHGTANGLFPVYTLTIYGNGTVTYKGIKNVETCGVETYQIPKDRAIEIVDEFNNIYYFSLKDKYYDYPKSLASLWSQLQLL